MIGIVESRADSASEHVAEQLRRLADWEPVEGSEGAACRHGPFELRTFDRLHLELEGVADAFDDPDLVVFASRHSGETGPLLSAHFTGNFAGASFGGSDGELAAAAPAALDRVVAALDEHAPPGYDVGIECTHHGPSEVGAPSLFVELGSGEAEWADPAGATAVARAILALDGLDDPVGGRTVVGFGGNHYAPRFARLLRETPWAVGHVAADWALEELGNPADARAVIGQAFERSGADHAVVDGDRPALADAVAALGHRVVSETWVREVGDLPLALADAVEDAIGTVDDGVRFGERAAVAADRLVAGDASDAGGAFAVVTLPDELVAEALAADTEATRGAVAATTVAYSTTEGGTRPAGQAAVEPPDDGTGGREALVDRLVAVLADAHEAVEREADAVVLHEREFDPERARELGVPEGPLFGDLAAGEAVTVDGAVVEPEDVMVERTSRVPLE